MSGWVEGRTWEELILLFSPVSAGVGSLPFFLGGGKSPVQTRDKGVLVILGG